MRQMARRLMDQEIEITIGQLLRVGVLSAASVVASGAVVYLAHHAFSIADYTVFHYQPAELSGVPAIIRNAFGGHGRGLIQLGLLLLIATPIARVVFSVFGFLKEKDRLYVVVTLIVLTILLYSLFKA